MHNMHEKIFEKYQDTTLNIRTLSSPLVEDAVDDDNYHELLMENFARIGELSVGNQKILDEYLFPILKDDYELSDSDRKTLWDFSRMLLDAYKMENINVHLRYRIINKLLDDAEKKQDLREIILSLDAKIETAFVLMHNAARLAPCDNRVYEYRDIGFETTYKLLEWLDEEKFASLPDDECKHIVLINSRYISALFERSDNYCAEVNRADFDMMKKTLALKDNDFYLKQAPDYNWKYHEFRTLQYITNFTELCNVRVFSPSELKEIQEYTRQLVTIYESDKEFFLPYCSEGMIDLYKNRIDYLCGDLDVSTYKNRLFAIISGTDQDVFSLHENTTFMVGFAEYMYAVDEGSLTNTDKSRFAYIYRGIISYVHHVPKMQGFSFLLTFLSLILTSYIEIGGREREFENFCLELLAALHPPTYVHMLSVADLTLAVTRHLCKYEPERFIGFMDCKTAEDVEEKALDILEFSYHAALCHDFGKLFVGETIITYDRKLLDEEFDLIKAHPLIGAHILEKHEDTKDYANVARFHHQWFDGSNGYPMDDDRNLPEKAIIDIVRIADCLDASTDTVGRSYKKGLSIEQIYKELEEGKDTSYAGYIVDLLNKDKVKEDIIQIINKNRIVNYYKAYKTLSKADQKG